MSIRATYPVIVDYDRDIEKILRDDAYINFISDIVLRQIRTKETGTKTIPVDLFGTKELSSSDGILWSMHARLRRPLEAIELLEFGEQHTDVQLLLPVIALGSLIDLGPSRHVFGLTSWEEKPALRLFPVSTLWTPEYYFASTRV
ncbi:MAG TPA: hypothetical protein VJ579_03730 [Candidatus Paceibacterota bacterium]|nr:hypothetical protein [Candidatus Paceibacterota bacterium]